MIDGVKFRLIVCDVGFSWSPKYAELFLVDSVLDPIKTHVDGFGAFLFAGAVGDGDSGGVVYLYRCWWLGMSKFFEGSAQGDGFLAVVK